MKKYILLIWVILLVGCQNNILQPVENEVAVLDPVIEIPGEIIIRNTEYTKRFEIDQFDEDMFMDHQLINLEYLKSIERFSYDYEEKYQYLTIVFQDQTLYVNLIDNTVQLNNQKPENNTLVHKELDQIYLNLDVLKLYFQFDYLTFEEPLFSLQLDFTESVELPITDALLLLPDKINMTWEAVYSSPTKIENLYEMPGLDIISPVWFHLKDDSGRIESKLQTSYMDWASEQGYTLWPAVTNNFDPDLTSLLLNNQKLRKSFIDELVTIYSENGFTGINIDFENIYLKDKDALSHFIAELTAAFHRKNIIVSMDVTFAGGSENWSQCYDRFVLGQWIDFLVVMSYDQHWGSSPVSGTVAGMAWLDENLAKLTEEVNPEKIIMGIPFYMRVWFERPSKDQVNAMKVTSDAITMHGMENIIASRELNKLWDETNGQYYVSYIDSNDNALKKIWIEDETSLALKVGLVHKFNLKGIASWRRGYELETVWDVLEAELRR